MSNLIKKFNVTINGGNTTTYEVGADAKNVQFSDEATSPFTQEFVENNDQNIDVPKEIISKAENRIYGNAYIKNNNTNIEGRPDDFGPVDDIQTDRTNEGAGALTITYGFNSLAKGHHSTAIGFDCEAAGWASHAEGWKTATAQSTNYSHAEGAKTEANHNAAHAEGDAAKAYGYGSHAEGRGTYVYGVGSHVEGMASNIGHADKVAWQDSNTLHGFDMTNDANNNDVDVELKNPKQIKNGQLSHAEGLDNTVYGSCCHAEGMYNTIGSVYGSTVMGESNTVNANTSLVIGYQNSINDGGANSLVLGQNNTNPGYPNCLFLGQYSDFGIGATLPPALVIGSGNEDKVSNLMTIRHPQTGAASQTNKGVLYGQNLDAYFNTVTQGPLYKWGQSDNHSWSINERPLIYIQEPDIPNQWPFSSDGTESSYEYQRYLEFDFNSGTKYHTPINIDYQNTHFTRAVIAGKHKDSFGYWEPFALNAKAVRMISGGGALHLKLYFVNDDFWFFDELKGYNGIWCDIIVFGYTY